MAPYRLALVGLQTQKEKFKKEKTKQKRVGLKCGFYIFPPGGDTVRKILPTYYIQSMDSTHTCHFSPPQKASVFVLLLSKFSENIRVSLLVVFPSASGNLQ